MPSQTAKLASGPETLPQGLAAPCVACGGESGGALPETEGPLLPGEGEYRWWQCQGCGSQFALPRRAMDYEEAHEDTEVYQVSFRSFADNLRRVENCTDGEWYNRAIAHLVLEATRTSSGLPEPSLLDVGAGSGFLLGLAHRLGYRVAGVDLSSKSRAFIEANVPGAVTSPSLEPFPGHFSHISALEVLEHVEDPLGFLQLLRGRLPAGGHLILSVPSVERLFWRLGGRGAERSVWLAGGAGDTSPHHLTRFSRAGLRTLLARAGFASAHVGYTPQDAVTLALWNLGAAPRLPLRIAGLTVPLPFAAIRGYLTREIAQRLWEIDESLGFGLMVLATSAPGRDAELESTFIRARSEAVRRHLAHLDRDLLRVFWDERGAMLNGIRAGLSRLLPWRSKTTVSS